MTDQHIVKNKRKNSAGHLLFVDDDAVCRLMGKHTFTAMGYDVTVASDGSDAVKK